MDHMKKTIFVFIALCIFIITALPVSAAGRWQETGDRLVVVIDPGHGGIDSGSSAYEAYEKDRNLATAIAFANELARYDGVNVYLTRTTDTELTLKERAEFAQSVNADLMISVHYNASSDHSQYGTEIWIPSASPNNAYCYQFARVWENEMINLGLFDRGTKLRINGLGRDYYGVIREAAYYGIPCVIMEHCHLDNANDRAWCDEDRDMLVFGRSDATAVAKYFGLQSSDLGVDYRSFDLEEVDTALIYGEVHNDPGATESTPPGPLKEGQENPEFNSIRKEIAESGKDPDEDRVLIEMPEAEKDKWAEDTVASAAETEVSAESIPAEETDPNEALMEELRRAEAERESLNAQAEVTKAAAEKPGQEQKNMLFPAIVFAVLLLAIMLILAFARDK